MKYWVVILHYFASRRWESAYVQSLFSTLRFSEGVFYSPVFKLRSFSQSNNHHFFFERNFSVMKQIWVSAFETASFYVWYGCFISETTIPDIWEASTFHYLQSVRACRYGNVSRRNTELSFRNKPLLFRVRFQFCWLLYALRP